MHNFTNFPKNENGIDNTVEKSERGAMSLVKIYVNYLKLLPKHRGSRNNLNIANNNVLIFLKYSFIPKIINFQS